MTASPYKAALPDVRYLSQLYDNFALCTISNSKTIRYSDHFVTVRYAVFELIRLKIEVLKKKAYQMALSVTMLNMNRLSIVLSCN